MAMRSQIKPLPASNLEDNLCRWKPGNEPHYEAWFLKLNERKTGRGFWFRYAIDSPYAKGEMVEPRAELCAQVFDRTAPDHNFGLVSRHKIESCTFDGGRDFTVRIGEGLLSGTLATGNLADGRHNVSWKLSFEPNGRTHHPLGRGLKSLLRPSWTACTPNLDARFSGCVVVDGRESNFESEPGCQSHRWGRKYPEDWVWVHSSAFERHPGSVFEGLAVRIRDGRSPGPLMSLFLRHRGEEHRFLRIRVAQQWRRNLGIGFWTFSAMNSRIHIEGAAQCRLRDMLQVEYRDPYGDPFYSINSEVANLKIRLFRRVHGIRWRHIETISARGMVHLEHASRSRDRDVRLAFE